ncbi:MAG: phosphoethanolamine--lipid A transferase [Gammaproteobacteria bacterium]|nr:phosphoethanolamine--lipid A transferase [Pseudomonadales bacterium]MCP5348948.1 phosphoethanolamine--lipid A transferase [Pseudomonadales bacterium]
MSQSRPWLTLSISRLILLVAGFFTVFYNLAFFRNSYLEFADQPGGLLFMGSLAIFLFAATVLVLSLLCVRFLTKPVLILVIFTAAGASYFMNRYNIVIDTTMLTNVAETDTREVRDLVNPGLLLSLLLLGVLPALLILKTRIVCHSFGREIWNRVRLAGAAMVLVIVSLLPFSAFYASFFREHKILRYYANPVTALYSAGKFMDTAFEDGNREITSLGLDAHIPVEDRDRELIFLVVGEAVRADHLGLNGYARQTTPKLIDRDVVSFDQVYSCGTATAYSVPCMFSLQERTEFDLDEANLQENLLDVLGHAGVSVLWRDNNSSSKGVAHATTFEDFRHPGNNPVCDEECRDIGMLEGLDEYIGQQENGDIVIVLHQMGNHGPAYFKRFPPEFATFQPYCQSNRLESCSQQEIVNAYDNAVLYTDYFLDQVIGFLERYNGEFATAMYYMSDHGESLGEGGVYLHGLPYLLAPDSQKHVASLLWLGDSYPVDRQALDTLRHRQLSHDNFFHTVLGLMEIQTSLYDSDKDILANTDFLVLNRD